MASDDPVFAQLSDGGIVEVNKHYTGGARLTDKQAVRAS